MGFIGASLILGFIWAAWHLLWYFVPAQAMNRLLETREAMLAECAVKDRIWGIGLSMADADRGDMGKWQGQNLLGFMLLEVRKVLSPEIKNH